MPRSPKLATTPFDLTHHVLDNGLRVVIAPDRSAPVVGVAVLYDVGFRSEPEGRTGFAHLFEHLMFQGSATLDKLEHARVVNSSGGTFNGSTHPDYTDYFELLPANALERGLFLEADRMTSPRLTAENLANQLDVVKNEIRVNVLNRPYGGLSLDLPAARPVRHFRQRPQRLRRLRGSRERDRRRRPRLLPPLLRAGNAVLAVGGDFDADETISLVERHFDGIAKRRACRNGPASPSRRRTASDAQTHHDPARTDPRGRTRAIECPTRYGVPEDHLATVLLAEVLSDGDASRLQRRLVHRDQSVTDIAAYVGEFGDPFDERDPTLLTITAHYPHTSGSWTRCCARWTRRLTRVADGRARHAANSTASRSGWPASCSARLDPVMGRTLAFAKFELVHGRAELVAELPERLAAVSARTRSGLRRPGCGRTSAPSWNWSLEGDQ